MVPLVVEKLINYIEMHGLYTEGMYRKPGSTNKIKELKLGLDTGERCESPFKITELNIKTKPTDDEHRLRSNDHMNVFLRPSLRC